MSPTPQLASDAARFGLDVAQLQELGVQAAKAKERAYCKLSPSLGGGGWQGREVVWLLVDSLGCCYEGSAGGKYV
jgi:hypothetical protein